MSEPRTYWLTKAAIRSLSNLEVARSLVLAGLPQSEVARVLGGFDKRGQSPEESLAAVTLYYAWAFQYLRRTEPALTWEDVQQMDIKLDMEDAPDDFAEAEAIVSVQAAVITGLPPAVAGDLSMSQMDEYRRIAEARDKAAKRRTRRAG